MLISRFVIRTPLVRTTCSIPPPIVTNSSKTWKNWKDKCVSNVSALASTTLVKIASTTTIVKPGNSVSQTIKVGKMIVVFCVLLFVIDYTLKCVASINDSSGKLLEQYRGRRL